LLGLSGAGSFELLKGYTSTWIAFRYSFISGTYLMAVSFGEALPFLAGLVLKKAYLDIVPSDYPIRHSRL
jgi:hypothetical protein